ASKSERKVHYSIRKFSIGVASVVVASLFLGGVVHATENEGITQVATSSNMANESQAEQGEQPKKLDSERDKARKEVEEYVKKIVGESYAKSTKKRHTNTVALVNELNNIKYEYLNKIVESTSESQLQTLMMESRSKVDEAVSKFEKDSSSSSSSDSSTKPEASDTAKPNKPTEPGKKVAEAQKKVEEAEKKAKDQKEKDHRNYPTITYKTLELEIAESDVEVKKAELELVKVKANEPLNEGTIKQAKAKVESKQAEATRLKKIKTDRKKAEEEAKRKAAEEDKVKEKPAEQPQPAPAPQPEKPTEEPENPAPAPKPEKPAEQPKAEKTDDQQAEEDYARRSEEENNRLTQQQPPKIEKPAQPSTPKTGWKQENGMWYFYNTDGSMATGWLQNNGSWYYLNSNGAMATGWL
ncbi:RICH domain-containing protein, partial [Streptococcus pneumoniae]|nr:RICH domain-containing protein [Streptococcus pneumoniae]